jgi:hypothetical protein
VSRPQKPWLDWRGEREALADLFSRPGGVVRVETSPAGPLLEFANALRSDLDNGKWTKPWKTIQLDPDNSNTRYFGEMVRQIERSLSVKPDTVTPLSLGARSKVASDLSASQITITDSFNFGSSEYDQAVANEKRSRNIVNAIRERIERESFCFIFIYSEKFLRHDLASFRNLLWSAGLADLSSKGVLLVDLASSGPRTDIEWPPSPEVRLRLPDEYDTHSREHAISDLTDFLLASGLETTELEAKTYSRAMLDSHNGPSALYAQLAAITIARRLRNHADVS